MTRRASLVAVGGTVLWGAGACTGGTRSGSTSGPSATGAASTGATAAPDPDERIVEEARAQLLRAIDLIRRTTSTHPGLSSTLTPLLDLHVAHDAVLVDSSPDSVAAPGPVVPDSRVVALRVVRRTESSLPAEFATLARRSTSGALARILASMSAATAQLLSAEPTQSSEPT